MFSTQTDLLFQCKEVAVGAQGNVTACIIKNNIFLVFSKSLFFVMNSV